MQTATDIPVHRATAAAANRGDSAMWAVFEFFHRGGKI
jgi:hypothetical protein